MSESTYWAGALEASRSDAQTIWTGFSMWGSRGAVLSPCWTEYVTLAVSCRPDTLWRNVISVACIHSHSFGHYTELLAGSKDWSVNRQLHVKAQHSLYRDRLVQHLDHYWHSTSLFRHMPLTFGFLQSPGLGLDIATILFFKIGTKEKTWTLSLWL